MPTMVPRPLSRRLLLAMLLLAAAPLALFARPAADAEARLVWCAGDPEIIVNGSVVSVTVHLPLENLPQVDYVEVVFHVPSNARVTGVINDSVLFEARPRVVQDLPAAYGLLGTPVTAEVIVHQTGEAFPVAATILVSGSGTGLWTQGTSAAPLTVSTRGLLNLRLL